MRTESEPRRRPPGRELTGQGSQTFCPTTRFAEARKCLGYRKFQITSPRSPPNSPAHPVRTGSHARLRLRPRYEELPPHSLGDQPLWAGSQHSSGRCFSVRHFGAARDRHGSPRPARCHSGPAPRGRLRGRCAHCYSNGTTAALAELRKGRARELQARCSGGVLASF